MRESLLPAEKIHSLLYLEPALALIGLAAASWLLYKTLLREVSDERHRNLRRRFKALFGQCLLFGFVFVAYQALHGVTSNRILSFLDPYLGLLTLLLGATILINTLRIMLFEYLFLGHMNVGVPLLLINIFTLLASLLVGTWILTEIFNLKIGPILATSAIFSVVLGLAMQDTLGNLFAGVALQIDKPYEIGHWIEVQNGNQRWVGQVYEISWRATVLMGLSDELMTIPNRTMAQAQISNFSVRNEPFARSQIFRIAHGTDLARAKKALLNACNGLSEIKLQPQPSVLAFESSESGISLKLVYFLTDYGSQFRVQDEVLSRGIESLRLNGIVAAFQRHQVQTVQNSLS